MKIGGGGRLGLKILTSKILGLGSMPYGVFLWDINVGKMQTQIRCQRMYAASDQGLHCLFTECSIKVLMKMINIAQQPLKRKWAGPIDEWGHSIGLKWVKYLLFHIVSRL